MMRQLLWGLVASLMAYGGWQFLRALRAAPRRPAAESSPGEDAGDALDDDLFDYAPAAADEAEAGAEAPAAAARQGADLFALELDVQRLRREIQGLREAFDEQRQDIDALRATVERLPAGGAGAMTPGASPEYGEALALARRGVLADEIAARCGITRAEAALVTSLSAHDRQAPAGSAS
ncbi:MAG: DUF2802 domain-containing protein [Azoarcus sp.]|jgi:hypothetical protein|nr:DUF2802 domain-containing protein [Azoarcus sp.]